MKGRTQALQVFEPQDPQQAEDEPYLAAFTLLKNRQPQALAAFEDLALLRPGDGLVAMHLARLRTGQVGDVMVLSEK